MIYHRFKPLTPEQIAHLFVVDIEAGRLFWANVTKHHPRLNGAEAGCARLGHSGKRYWIVKINRVPYRRSQLILTAATGVWPAETVDHINGNSLDDRACNLRHATLAENARTHKRRAKNSPLPMGVRLAASGKYQARIAHNNRSIALGVFQTAAAAQAAYQIARKELFGDFA